MPRLHLGILLLLSACTGREEEETLGGWLDAGPADVVSVQRSIGPAPHAAIARAVNAFGVAVEGADDLKVDVDQVPVDVTFDSWGYGEVVVADPGAKEVWFEESMSPVYATGAALEPFHMLPGSEALGLASNVVGVTEGVLAAVDNDVWFVPATGDAHRVLTFSEDLGPVLGLRAGYIDRDDALDAIAWAGNTVIILRGRVGGGMVWGGGIQPNDINLFVGDAVIADVSNDSENDVVVAWKSLVSEDQLQVWEGNGLFSFEDWPTVGIQARPGALAVGDNAGDGTAHITVLLEGEDNWQRWSVLDDQLLGVGPSLETLGMPEGSSLSSGVDYNGDGADELLIIGPESPGQPRVVKMYDLAGGSNGTINFIEEAYQSAHFAVADGDGDGVRDFFALEDDGRLVSLSWNGQSYSQKKVGDLSGGGSFHFSDVNGDGLADLFLAGETWSWWTGKVDVGTASDWWAVDSPSFGSWSLGRRGPVVSVDLDADPLTTEFTSVVVDGGISYAQLWTVEAGDPPSAKAAGRVELSVEGAEGIDIAICGTRGYFLTETNLSRVDLSSGTRLGVLPTVASRVACGAGPSGSVVALLLDGEVQLLDSALNEVAVEAHPGAVDVALVNLGGTPRVGVCEEAGCVAEAWSLGEIDALLVGTPTELRAQWAGGVQKLSGRGVPAVADVNGDGFEDAIVVWPNGTGTAVGVYLGAAGSFGPARVMHTTRAGEGPAILGDVSGDSVLDVLFGDLDDGILTSL